MSSPAALSVDDHPDLDLVQAPDSDLSQFRSPSALSRMYTLEDELTAIQDGTFLSDDSGIGDLDHDCQPEPEYEYENNSLPSPTPTDLNHLPQTPFIAANLADLTIWHETLTSLTIAEHSDATHEFLSAHTTMLYRFVVHSVLPHVAALEKYSDAAMRDNERLVERLAEMRGLVEELGEVYSREVRRSRAKTEVLSEVVDMVGCLLLDEAEEAGLDRIERS
ncbi:hypothetical protein EDD37DRAFT_650464 [Exophiala viscosa]|uniref:uncharacterized protein n=1 Tax=Exophiala viscosa TaxID=2486360 RepID=UPI00218DD6E6|nr:hypothetical protein EDD37DRAFT_650464 [Exophiala viscosa]